jgi:hypothetical protein
MAIQTGYVDAALIKFSDSLVPSDEFISPAKEMINKVMTIEGFLADLF